MDVTNKSRVISSLEKNDDFALVSVLPASLNIEKLLQNKLFLVANSKTDSKRRKFKKTFEIPLIYREGSGTRQMMENFIERNTV
jgi:hypothetical protein